MPSRTGRAAARLVAAGVSLAAATPPAVARLAVDGPLAVGGPLDTERQPAVGGPVCASGTPLLAAGPLEFFVTPEG